MATYKIIRFYFESATGGSKRTIDTGLTLEEARAHCKDPESSSKTCTGATAKRRTRSKGPWFDGFDEE